MLYDVVIVGGGPAGLSAALALGRARKRVLLCDSGPRRNAAAVHIQNFVTRDGTPPDEFRRIARQQLASYDNVEVRDARVESVSGQVGAFRVGLAPEAVGARRILLCTGLVDEMLPIDGLRELWGSGVVQCPYCHGWEARHLRWGFLGSAADVARFLPFSMQLRGWTREQLSVFTNGSFDVPQEIAEALRSAGIRLETAPVVRLVAREGKLEAVELAGGAQVPCELLFAHPPQRQVELVRGLGVALDEHGCVQVDPMKRETSVPGIYAAGDLTTRQQAAVLAAAAGMQAAVGINLDVTMELVAQGQI